MGREHGFMSRGDVVRNISEKAIPRRRKISCSYSTKGKTMSRREQNLSIFKN